MAHLDAPACASRLLAGRGFTVASIMADDTIAARSKRVNGRVALACPDRRRAVGRVIPRRPAPAR